ncbi:hypothetical protein GCU60_01385 [Blastococcus saxobsidens]|uniref:Uncharacterized protein n=1 Tax=Blastococcus saxobsidens TaxID=138336 RepID=A0A6L9VXM0_9ACTN|nr:hypothetical protein [Blastococcus saxobsidens]NEK84418.1 hypothetical protein [Blastococcus saxobsidens]
MHPTTAPRRTPPAAALAAAVLGLLSAAVPALIAFLAVAFSGGRFDGGGWAVVVVPLGYLVGLVVGAVLLLLGRSWLVLAVFTGTMAVLVTVGYVTGGLGGGFLELAVLVPLVATVLAALPGVRRWVAARRAATRPAGGTRSARPAR